MLSIFRMGELLKVLHKQIVRRYLIYPEKDLLLR